MTLSTSIRLSVTGLLVSLVLADAVSQPVHISSGKGNELSVTPGELLTIPVRLSVADRSSISGRLVLDAPAAWKQRSVSPQVTLQLDKPAVLLPSFTIPRTAPAGVQPIRAFVADSTGRSLSDTLLLRVRVARVVSFAIRLIDAPKYALGGDRLAYRYELTNTGNDQTSFTADATSSLGYSVDISSPLMTIAPGASERFVVTALSPTSTRIKEQHSLSLTVTPSPEGEPQSLTTVSDVVPRATSSQPDQVKFPVYGTARFTRDNDNGGLQGEIFGVGSLSRDRSDKLDFLLRSPETQTLTALGVRDEFRARYVSGQHSVYAGDWNYALTPLTEVGRYAFGVGGQTKIGDVTTGGFLNRTRIGAPTRRQAAGFVRYDVSPSLLAGVNVLKRDEALNATIASANIVTTPYQSARLLAEAATSSADAGNDAAFTARLMGSIPELSYDVQLVHAGKDFASYYRDMQVASLSLATRASNSLRFELLARDESRNIRRDTSVGFAPHTRFVQLGGGFTNAFSVYYRASTLEDPVSVARPDRREDIVQLRGTFPFKVALVSLYADVGSVTDRAAGVQYATNHYALSASASPMARLESSATIDLTKAPDVTTGSMEQRVSASLAATYYFTQGTRAFVTLFSSRTRGLTDFSYSVLESSVDHLFPSQHRVGGRFRMTTVTGSTPEYAAAVEYTVPLGIPLGSDPSTGILTGRIVDEEGNGVSEVYVSSGNRGGITDADGMFIIRELPPGENLVTVDRATLGLQRITDVPLPVPVFIVGGEESSLSLRTIRPSTLQGRLRLFSFAPSGVRDSSVIVEEELRGQAMIAVELRSERGMMRALSDSRGQIILSDVRAGKWQATYTPVLLPSGYALAETEDTFVIEPGETRVFEVKIAQRRRVVRIIQEGGILRPKQ